jgi:hypothetical protein
VSYDAVSAGQRMRSWRWCSRRKLIDGTTLLPQVHAALLGGWAPEQIAWHGGRYTPMCWPGGTPMRRLQRHRGAASGELGGASMAVLRQLHERRLGHSRGTDQRWHLDDRCRSTGGPTTVPWAAGARALGGDLVKGVGKAYAAVPLSSRRAAASVAKMDGVDPKGARYRFMSIAWRICPLFLGGAYLAVTARS